ATAWLGDPGLHQLGWDRQPAIQYMLENTALAKNNIENEVDRYIGWPGQAPAYQLRHAGNLRPPHPDPPRPRPPLPPGPARARPPLRHPPLPRQHPRPRRRQPPGPARGDRTVDCRQQ